MREAPVRPERQVLRLRLEERLADEARFIKTWLDKPILTGAVSPSGRHLARMMARAVEPSGEAPIVELGPGTGPITQALLQRGVDPARLVLVEFDSAFCRLLQKRFPKVRVVQGDAYRLRQSLDGVLGVPAAAVVSSLPLLNKPDVQRLRLLDEAFAMMAASGIFVQFTYGANSPVPRDAYVAYEADVSPPVWLNLPPARVWVYRRRDPARAAAPGAAMRCAAERRRHGGIEPWPFRPARDPRAERLLRRFETRGCRLE